MCIGNIHDSDFKYAQRFPTRDEFRLKYVFVIYLQSKNVYYVLKEINNEY